MKARRTRQIDGARRSSGRAHQRKAPLEAYGWICTRAGRWIDPQTGRSYTAAEAWEVVADRGTLIANYGEDISTGDDHTPREADGA